MTGEYRQKCDLHAFHIYPIHASRHLCFFKVETFQRGTSPDTIEAYEIFDNEIRLFQYFYERSDDVYIGRRTDKTQVYDRCPNNVENERRG